MGEAYEVLVDKVGVLLRVPAFGNVVLLCNVESVDGGPFIAMYGSLVLASSCPLATPDDQLVGELYEKLEHIINEAPEDLKEEIIVIPVHALAGYEPNDAYIVHNEDVIQEFVKDPKLDTSITIELK